MGFGLAGADAFVEALAAVDLPFELFLLLLLSPVEATSIGGYVAARFAPKLERKWQCKSCTITVELTRRTCGCERATMMSWNLQRTSVDVAWTAIVPKRMAEPNMSWPRPKHLLATSATGADAGVGQVELDSPRRSHSTKAKVHECGPARAERGAPGPKPISNNPPCNSTGQTHLFHNSALMKPNLCPPIGFSPVRGGAIAWGTEFLRVGEGGIGKPKLGLFFG